MLVVEVAENLVGRSGQCLGNGGDDLRPEHFIEASKILKRSAESPTVIATIERKDVIAGHLLEETFIVVRPIVIDPGDQVRRENIVDDEVRIANSRKGVAPIVVWIRDFRLKAFLQHL